MKKILDSFKDSRCYIKEDRLPKGFFKLDAYTDGNQIVLCGPLAMEDEEHNCDQMGCGSFNHVLYRYSI